MAFERGFITDPCYPEDNEGTRENSMMYIPYLKSSVPSE